MRCAYDKFNGIFEGNYSEKCNCSELAVNFICLTFERIKNLFVSSQTLKFPRDSIYE
jgi:hypothetical protein